MSEYMLRKDLGKWSKGFFFAGSLRKYPLFSIISIDLMKLQ